MDEPRKPYENLRTAKKSATDIEFAAEVPAATFKNHRQGALAALGANAKIPGFRPGKVPNEILEKHLNENDVLEEAVHRAVGDAVRAILRDEQLRVLGSPRITVKKMVRDSTLEFSLSVSIAPELKLPDYRTIAQDVVKNRKEVPAVLDAEVDAAIKQVLRTNAASPADADLKDAAPPVPELTNEFVKTLGDFTDVLDFRLKVRDALAREKGFEARKALRESIAEKILDATDIPFSEEIVDEELQLMKQEREEAVSRMGTTMEEYLKQIQKTEEDVVKDERAYVIRQLKTKLLFDAIANKEHIVADPHDVERAAAVLARENPDADPAYLTNYAHSMLVNEMVLQFLESKDAEPEKSKIIVPN